MIPPPARSRTRWPPPTPRSRRASRSNATCRTRPTARPSCSTTSRSTGSPPQTGLVRERKAADLAGTAIRGAASGYPDACGLSRRVAGRAPLVIEIKSGFDNDLRLTHRTVDVVSGYKGPVALKSFDPFVVAAIRTTAPQIPRGIVAETATKATSGRSCRAISATTWQTSCISARPSPTSCPGGSATCLAPRPFWRRHLRRMPVMAWTVRTEPTGAARPSTPTRWCSRGSDPILLRPWRPTVEATGCPAPQLSSC